MKPVHFILIRLILASLATALVAAQSNPMSASPRSRTTSSEHFATRRFQHASAESQNQTLSLTFAPVVDYRSGGYAPESVAVADVNGDGKPDIVAANFCVSSTPCPEAPSVSPSAAPGMVGVLLGNGDGTFQTAVTYGSGGYNATSVAVADVNGDGKPDLIVANSCGDSTCAGDGSVSVLLGSGDGTFQTAVSYDSGGIYAASVAVADVNGDGKPDLLVINETGCNSTTTCSSIDGFTEGAVGVLLNNGNGTFQAAVAYDSGGIFATSIAVGDVSGDGKPDLVVAQCSGTSIGVATCFAMSAVGVMLGNGNGTFQAAVNYGASLNGDQPNTVALADLNGDGDLDILMTNSVSGDHGQLDGLLGVLLGNGNGTFQTVVTYDPGGGAAGLTIADLTGNGKLDAVVTSATEDSLTGALSDAVAVFSGNGDGTFQSAVLYPISPAPARSVSVVAAVLNGNGLPDLVVGTAPSSNSVGVLLNTSGEDFTLAASPASVTVTSGQAANYTLTVSGINGFAQKVDFSCSGAPAHSTCTVSPSDVTLSGSGVTTAMVTVATTGASASVLHPAGSPWANNRFAFWLAFSSLTGFVLLGIRPSCSGKRQGWLLHGLALTCVLSLAITCSGCGSGSNSNLGSSGVAPGTYKLTVTGTSTSGGATLTKIANLTLVVQ